MGEAIEEMEQGDVEAGTEPLRSAESPPDADQPAKDDNDWMKLSQGTPELPSSPLVDPAGATEEAHVGKSSVFASSINLSNTILGAGTLAMPYACRQCGIALFGILLLVMALGSHFAIRMLTSCVVKNNLVAAKYPSLGALAYGRKGEIAAGLAVVLQQLGPCITYIQITSDVLEPILCKAAGDNGGVMCSRTFWQLIAVATIVFPTSMIERMDTLKHISGMAMTFILSFCFAVLVRGIWVLNDTSLRMANWDAIEDNSFTYNNSAYDCTSYHSGCYKIEPPGTQIKWFDFGPDMLKALPILCFAFLCHQNMFPVLEELENPGLKRMTYVSISTMLTCASMYFMVGVFGYLTFLESVKPTRGPDSSSGDVLTLYKVETDGYDFAAVMDILRVGYGLSLIFSYPIMLFELRHAIERYFTPGAPYSKRRHLLVNTCIIVPCTLVAILVKSVGTVFGLLGSTTSPTIVFILPALFYLKLRPADAEKKPKMRAHAWIILSFGLLMIPVCVVMWVIGLA